MFIPNRSWALIALAMATPVPAFGSPAPFDACIAHALEGLEGSPAPRRDARPCDPSDLQCCATWTVDLGPRGTAVAAEAEGLEAAVKQLSEARATAWMLAGARAPAARAGRPRCAGAVGKGGDRLTSGERALDDAESALRTRREALGAQTSLLAELGLSSDPAGSIEASPAARAAAYDALLARASATARNVRACLRATVDVSPHEDPLSLWNGAGQFEGASGAERRSAVVRDIASSLASLAALDVRGSALRVLELEDDAVVAAIDARGAGHLRVHLGSSGPPREGARVRKGATPVAAVVRDGPNVELGSIEVRRSSTRTLTIVGRWSDGEERVELKLGPPPAVAAASPSPAGAGAGLGVDAPASPRAGAGAEAGGLAPAPISRRPEAHARAEPVPGVAPPVRALGIGSVVHLLDDTTESFTLLRYLRDHPVELSGAALPVALVDAPSDSAFAVTGQVDGTIGNRLLDGQIAFAYDTKARFKIWRDGARVGEVEVACAGRTAFASHPPSDLRAQVIAPCYAQLRDRLVALLAGAGGQP